MKNKILFILCCISVFLCSCNTGKKGFSVRIQTAEEKEKSKEMTDFLSDEEIQKLLVANSTVIYNDEEFMKFVEEAEKDTTIYDAAYSDAPLEDLISEAEAPVIEIPEGDILEIKEKLFITQINDMYYNFESYKDKTVIVEGMFTEMVSFDGKNKYPAVYRLGPGCCGNDGWGGFLLDYKKAFPKYDDWIRVTGKPVLEKTSDGYDNLYLKVISLEVKTERGAEFVKN